MALGTETVGLEVKTRISEGFLEIRYVLVNHGPQALVTYDGATGLGGGEYPDLTGQCYVSYVPPGKARISRIRPPAHPTKDTTRTFIPTVAEVKPGEPRNVQFRLPLPLKERSQFSPEFAGSTWERRSATRLELRIAYFRKTSTTLLKPLGAPNVWQVVRGASQSDVLFVDRAVPVTLEVLVRTDPSFIRM
jgi:hypothetical protein